jgi:hypothetical protein
MTKMIRDPNFPARDLTKWFGFAFTTDRHARLAGQHNADTEEQLLAHFRFVASEPWKIHYWPPGMNPTRRVRGSQWPTHCNLGSRFA